jgi:hypothetical protein
MIRDAIIRKKAVHIEVVVLKAVRSGTVNNVPRIPKPKRSGLRPILSDNAPKTGCRQANINNEINEIRVDCSLVR